MASTIVRALIEGATWESIQAQPYDGTRYPCGCHPHPKEPHLRFHLCDYHDGFDSGVDQGCHELQTEIERLRALADQLVHLLPHFHLSQRCQPPQGVALEDWCTECHVVATYRGARRER